jgi:hypothetical protein
MVMEVEYELTPEDVVAFNRYSRWGFFPRPPTRWKTDLIILGLLVVSASVLVYVLFALDFSLSSLFYSAFPPFISVFTSILTIFLMNRILAPTQIWKTLRQGRNAEMVLGWQQIALNAQGVRRESQFSSSIHFWKGIDKVATTEEHVFFYLRTATAYIVPLRAFPDGRAFDAFADAAKRYYETAGVAEAGECKRPQETGIQAPGESGRAERIVPKRDA